MDRRAPLPAVRSLDELCTLVRGRQLYVRVSRGPDADADERSRDYESGMELPGLSVNPLFAESWWRRPLQDWIARQLCDYAHLRDETEETRRVWVLEGDVVGRGPDNEPLVARVRPVAWVDDACVQEAERRYRERFAVGRDSTRG